MIHKVKLTLKDFYQNYFKPGLIGIFDYFEGARMYIEQTD